MPFTTLSHTYDFVKGVSGISEGGISWGAELARLNNVG